MSEGGTIISTNKFFWLCNYNKCNLENYGSYDIRIRLLLFQKRKNMTNFLRLLSINYYDD
jgi:hypothetical protein